MTCVLGMVVRREREIREFVKTPFYRVISTIDASGHSFEGEWRAVKGSRYFESFDLYKENGFKTEEKAKELIAYLLEEKPIQCIVESVEKKKEKKNPPLLYNLAELQNDCRSGLRTVRMKRFGSCRNYMKKNLLHTRGQTPGFCRRQLQKRSAET